MGIKKLSVNREKGFAHIALVAILVVLVAGAAGFAYWRISSYNNNKDANGKAVSGSNANTATVSDECVAKTGDENICHLGAISDLSKFASEVHLTMSGAEGPVTSIVKFDGKGNNYVDTGTGILGISVGGKYYVYMDKWYDTGNDASMAPKDSIPAFDFATTAGIKYENLGKQKCGDATCFNYRMSGGILGDGVVTALFGDKDYLPRRIESTGGLLGKMTMTIEYKAVTITAPEGALPISSLTGSN